MAVTPIEIINVGGLDYIVRDQEAISLASSAMNEIAYKPHLHAIVGGEERGTTYSVARAANNCFIWYNVDPAHNIYTASYPKNGCLMMTTRAVSKGTSIIHGTNCIILPIVDGIDRMGVFRNGNNVIFRKHTGVEVGVGDFAMLSTRNNFQNTCRALKQHGIAPDNFDDAQLVTAAHADDIRNNGSRAAIGFHNAEHPCLQIYLDTNGDLVVVHSNGSIKRIVTS